MSGSRSPRFVIPSREAPAWSGMSPCDGSAVRGVRLLGVCRRWGGRTGRPRRQGDARAPAATADVAARSAPKPAPAAPPAAPRRVLAVFVGIISSFASMSRPDGMSLWRRGPFGLQRACVVRSVVEDPRIPVPQPAPDTHPAACRHAYAGVFGDVASFVGLPRLSGALLWCRGPFGLQRARVVRSVTEHPSHRAALCRAAASLSHRPSFVCAYVPLSVPQACCPCAIALLLERRSSDAARAPLLARWSAVPLPGRR